MRRTLIRNLYQVTVSLPDGDNGALVEVPIKDLGIGYPTIVQDEPLVKEILIDPNQKVERGPAEEAAAPASQTVQRYEFTVQFCWQPIPASERRARRRQRAAEAETVARRDS